MKKLKKSFNDYSTTFNKLDFYSILGGDLMKINILSNCLKLGLVLSIVHSLNYCAPVQPTPMQVASKVAFMASITALYILYVLGSVATSTFIKERRLESRAPTLLRAVRLISLQSWGILGLIISLLIFFAVMYYAWQTPASGSNQ